MLTFAVLSFLIVAAKSQGLADEESDWADVYRESDKDILWCALSAQELDKCRRFAEAAANDHARLAVSLNY